MSTRTKSALLLGLFCLMTSGAMAGTPEEDYEAGAKLYRNEDVMTAMPLLKSSAERGHAQAQYLYGYLLDAAEEDAEAVKWYHKAADQNVVPAMVRLAEMYRIAEGVKKDDKQALAFLQRAADTGNVTGVAALADAYATGILGLEAEVRKDPGPAWALINRASEGGDIVSWSFIVDAYAKGNERFGIKQDVSKALAMVTEAADKNSLPALDRLAKAHKTGQLGLPADAKKAKAIESKITALKEKQAKEAKK